jgi:hypothetical protein
MAQAAQRATNEQQLGFFGGKADVAAPARPARPAPADRQGAPVSRRRVRNAEERLCAGCRAREARYGFRRHEDDPTTDRPRTLCFECFRMELTRRQSINEQLARGWNASQVSLPLEQKLNDLTRRRRRAQIAARKALGL